MAEFLIETGANALEYEELFLEEQLKYYKYVHEYRKMELDDIDKVFEQGKIPVGTIDFVTRYLRNNYDFDKENPIEIPKYLRTDEFLKRSYRIVDWTNIPINSKIFLKDVSELKVFGEVVNTEYFDIDAVFNYEKQYEGDNSLVLDKTHLWQVSSVLPIEAEFRVYVCGGIIENIGYYNGDCTLQPDINLIKKAVGLIRQNEKWLRSYTIDVAVGSFGTALLEIHNFASVGLYCTQWGTGLPYAYIDGINYLLNDNKTIEI